MTHESHRAERAADPRSDDELVADALSKIDSDEDWEAIWVLTARGAQPQLDLALRLAGSHVIEERRLGARILGRLGFDTPAFLDESVTRLIDLLGDPAEDVLVDAIYGLGHRHDPRGFDAVLRFHSHTSADLRCAVAWALSSDERGTLVPARIALMRDSDRDTRDWATFGFRIQSELDGPETPEVLLERAEDEHAEIRGEALLALAERKDPRVIPLVRRELARPFEGGWAIEAAGLTGDESLLPDLRAAWDRLEVEEQCDFDSTVRFAFQALGATGP